MLEENEMKVQRKIVGKTKINRTRANKSENPMISNLLMSGWKEERRRRD